MSTLGNEIKKAVDNVADAASELTHRSRAEGERTEREAAGDAMTTGEKMRSHFNEAKENAQAEMDRAKRDVRNNV